jgi:alpha-beta hydrolase superfamily lysophospholipase
MLSLGHAAETLDLTAADGTNLTALTEQSEGAKKGVVLVHMANRHAGDWRFFAEKLARNQFLVIAPNLRGHGDGEDIERPSAEDYPQMVEDVRAAVVWLREQGATEISCAGAQIGANLCLQVAGEDPEIVNLALLSPGLNHKGVTISSAVKNYGNRPMLVVASSEDVYATRTAVYLEEHTVGQTHVEMLEGAGTGTKMLNRDPNLSGTVLSWLLGSFQLSSGDIVLPTPKMDETHESVETRGKKLGAHQR